MRKNEFFDYVESHILDNLGPEYQDATVEIREVNKSNDVVLHGLTISNDDNVIVPVVYLEDFYEQHQNGLGIDSVMDRIAEVRMKAEHAPFEFNYQDFMDFDKVKDSIHVRICDPDLNRNRLEDVISKDYGDFTATYYIELPSNDDSKGTVAVNQALLDRWGITPEQLNATALHNDMQSAPSLTSIQDLMESMMFGGDEPKNYLESADSPNVGSFEVPMFCLTNGEKTYGASLIINPDVQQTISKVVDGDYFVLPSSQHEVLIIPESADISVDELSSMVQQVNQTEVSPQDLLSDKVQHYSAYTKVMENARDYESKVKEHPEAYGKEIPEMKQSLPSDPIR